MNYWLDLFTGTTWAEFQAAGATITGFRHRMRNQASKVKPGDIFLCYLTGVMRWVGALHVVSPSTSQTKIWSTDDFPVRFEVKPLIVLTPEHGIPMEKLEGKLCFYQGTNDRGKFKGFVRSSPAPFKREGDGQVVLDLLRKAQSHPVVRPVDPKKLARRPMYKAELHKGKTTVSTVVTVPEPEDAEFPASAVPPLPEAPNTTRHSEIQFQLLRLGAEMGLDVWVARNDRSRAYQGIVLGTMPGMLNELPTQFNEATNRTIELIDILWLKGNGIVAAFEVECTTSIYSGLLRMSDLLALQPNLDIRLYLVAPDERRSKVEQEILRPTFKVRERPLHEICGFLAFSDLTEKADGILRLGLAASLKPDFLKDTAEYFGASEEPIDD